jgi:membrane protein
MLSNAGAYGPVGTVLTVESWLVGVGFVVFGGALVGRHIRDSRILRVGAEIPRPQQPEGWFEVPTEEPAVLHWRSDGSGGTTE